jgi:hypothetical protein
MNSSAYETIIWVFWNIYFIFIILPSFLSVFHPSHSSSFYSFPPFSLPSSMQEFRALSISDPLRISAWPYIMDRLYQLGTSSITFYHIPRTCALFSVTPSCLLCSEHPLPTPHTSILQC